jgi:transposase
VDAVLLEERVADLEKQLVVVLAANERLAAEREEYRKLYVQALELCKKLEAGIVGPKRERLSSSDAQLTLALLAQLLGERAASAPAEPVEKVRAHTRARPTGRKPLPEHLPRVDIEILPPEVEQHGRDAFERIGEDVSETVERRPASLVVVRVHKPKFVPKTRDRLAETHVVQASPPELPIPRALAGPGMLADTVVKRWQDHLPLHRLEKIYGRDGIDLARSTVCGWHGELAQLAKPLVRAMWDDALAAPYLCTDATGVLVQALEKCRRAHFWVVLAPELHVLFGYSPKHDSATVDRMLRGYKGKLVADAHAVFDHLFRGGDVVECGCWSHARRYFYKALDSDPERAKKALAFIGGLFRIERGLKDAHAPPSKRLEVRAAESKPIAEAFFAWCDVEAFNVLDETPITKAIGYARNQRKALEQFLDDGRLPIHNNSSERELRRQAVGRKNWLFVGNDDGGEVNATFVTLLASCQLHQIEPWSYLRDLFCLLPSWPVRRVLQLAPAYWNKTLQDQEAQQRLAANVFRNVTLGPLELHRDNT